MKDRYLYKNRKSIYHDVNHIHDNYKNMGFDYKGKIYEKTTSPEIRSNPFQRLMLSKIENILYYLINEVKSIKKHVSIAHDKNATNIK